MREYVVCSLGSYLVVPALDLFTLIEHSCADQSLTDQPAKGNYMYVGKSKFIKESLSNMAKELQHTTWYTKYCSRFLSKLTTVLYSFKLGLKTLIFIWSLKI